METNQHDVSKQQQAGFFVFVRRFIIHESAHFPNRMSRVSFQTKLHQVIGINSLRNTCRGIIVVFHIKTGVCLILPSVGYITGIEAPKQGIPFTESRIGCHGKQQTVFHKTRFQDSERTLLPNIGRVPPCIQMGKDVVLPGRSSQRRNMRAVTLLQLFINVIQVSGMRRIPHHRGVEFGLAHPMLLKHGLHVTVTFKVHAVPSRLCHGLCDVVIIKQIFQFLWLNQTGRYAGLTCRQ